MACDYKRVTRTIRLSRLHFSFHCLFVFALAVMIFCFDGGGGSAAAATSPKRNVNGDERRNAVLYDGIINSSIKHCFKQHTAMYRAYIITTTPLIYRINMMNTILFICVFGVRIAHTQQTNLVSV